MAIAALLIATAIPLLFLYLIHTLDLYGTGSSRAIILSFCWGAVSVFIAFAVYQPVHDRLGLFDDVSLLVYFAPFLEETLKTLILLYLVRRPTFTYFVDGAVYGFAVGIGFAVFENYLYVIQNLDMGMGAALGRVLSTNLMHASAGAIVGIALGLSRFRRFSRRAFFLLVGLLLAVLFHAGFNNLLINAGVQSLFLYAAGIGTSGVAFIALVIRRGLAVEKAWISETLGAADRVTAAEAAAVRRLGHADGFLEPLTAIFGAEKAAKIVELLILQAQLGILRKTLDRAQGSVATHNALAKQLARKQEEMEAARRSVGAYTMASLRILFPEEGSPMWQRLEAALRQRPGAQQGTHVNLYSLIDSKSRGRDQRRSTEE